VVAVAALVLLVPTQPPTLEALEAQVRHQVLRAAQSLGRAVVVLGGTRPLVLAVLAAGALGATSVTARQAQPTRVAVAVQEIPLVVMVVPVS